jgi:choline kinase
MSAPALCHSRPRALVPNDRAHRWNNAYSLWLAREHFARGALLVNGDTVHPASVEKTLLAARGTAG